MGGWLLLCKRIDGIHLQQSLEVAADDGVAIDPRPVLLSVLLSVDPIDTSYYYFRSRFNSSFHGRRRLELVFRTSFLRYTFFHLSYSHRRLKSEYVRAEFDLI